MRFEHEMSSVLNNTVEYDITLISAIDDGDEYDIESCGFEYLKFKSNKSGQELREEVYTFAKQHFPQGWRVWSYDEVE